MKKQSMPYEAPELVQISVRVEKGFAVGSDIEPGTGGGELGVRDRSPTTITNRVRSSEY